MSSRTQRTQRHIHLLSTGGTIAMGGSGAQPLTPSMDAEQLLNAVPSATSIARVTSETVQSVPSSHMSISDVLRVTARVEGAIESGADGVVIVQGTDSLEEVAFLADVVLPPGVPVILTGAMRGFDQPGTDGPSNIISSIRAAASDEVRGAGVLVCMSGELHAARFVRKTHSISPSAFSSPSTGCCGWIAEDRVRMVFRPAQPPRLKIDASSGEPPRVALYRIALGDDARWVSKIGDLGYRGLVVEAFGAGHVSPEVRHRLVEVAEVFPVVLTSRTGAGEVLTATYGFEGSETDLFANGLISGALLDGLKARLMLSLALSNGYSRNQIAESLIQWSQ